MGKRDLLIKQALDQAGYQSPAEAIMQVPLRYERAGQAVMGRLPEIDKCVEVTMLARVRSVVQESMHPPRFSASLSRLNADGNICDTIHATGIGILDGSHPLVRAGHEKPIVVAGTLLRDYWGYRLLEVDVLPTGAPLLPVYPKRAKVAHESTRKAVATALVVSEEAAAAAVRKAFDGWTEDEILEVGSCLSKDKPFRKLVALIRQLHLPENEGMAELAREYATALSVADIIVQVQRKRRSSPVEGAALNLNGARIKEMIGSMPFKLTDGQLDCMRKIYFGLIAPQPQRILLSGDVGTGKTCVFAVLAVAAAEAGHQVVIFSPNSILANQTYKELTEWFPSVKVAMVTGKSKPGPFGEAEKPILVGTSALFRYCEKMGIVPDLLVVDEQQKTSRQQRETLLAPHSNLIEATATCIPRTGALVMYGGMDLSVLREYPVKRTIKSMIVRPDGKHEMFRDMKAAVKAGDKIAVILPLVRVNGSRSDNPSDDERYAVENAYPIWNELFPGQVVPLHGKMKEAEKIAALELVKSGQKDVILATSIIEIGVTIKDLKVLVVVDADKYGVSSLHQMRGRLARNGGQGRFYMYLRKDDVSEKTLERLNFLVMSADGFDLSERDMNHRGFGDVADDSEQQAGEVVTLFSNVKFYPPAVDTVGKTISAVRGEEVGW